MQFRSRTDVHLRRIAGREKCVLVILGQHFAQDAFEGSVGAIGPVHMEGKTFFQPDSVFNGHNLIVGDFIFANDPVGRGAEGS